MAYNYSSISDLNASIQPFTLYTDVNNDCCGNSFRKGTQFSYIGGTQVQATLSVRSLHNMFDTTNTVIDTQKYGMEPYQYFNLIKSLAQGQPAVSPIHTIQNSATAVMTTAERNAISVPIIGSIIYNTDTGLANVWTGAVWQDVVSGGCTDPQLPETKNPNVRIQNKAVSTPVISPLTQAPHKYFLGTIKKIYCPYNCDIIVYDTKNNRISELCGQLTPEKVFAIMPNVNKTTVFEGFDYFKEACFDMDLLPRVHEFENDDFAALEQIKLAQQVSQKGNEWKLNNGNYIKS